MTDLPSRVVQRSIIAIGLTLALALLWALTHRYQEFARDGELYAFQALARIHPALDTDLYLRNTSQDQFSIFSRIYACLIRSLGLHNAGLALFTLFTAWFLGAAWNLARSLGNRDAAWLTAALFVVTAGYYGSYKIFYFAEDYLTARTAAEALVVTALACHFRGRPRLGLLVASGALFVHPLMALPGVLLLIYLGLPLRQGLIASAVGIVVILGVAITALAVPAANLLPTLDPAWLEVVQERSQFLFLQYWTAQDWDLNARPFVSLTLTALAVDDARIRKLSMAAMTVGATGLAVAAIAGSVGSLAILLQGQAWRWLWVTGFCGVLLLAPAILRIWSDKNCGALCAMLLVLGWTCPALDGLACTEAALVLWLLRGRLAGAAQYLRWAAVGAAALTVTWILANAWTSHQPLPLARIRELFAMEVPGLLLAAAFYWSMRNLRYALFPMWSSAALLIALVLVLPGSLRQSKTVGTPAEIEEFSDWRSAIPPTSNVLVLPTKNSASFVWFTLERPSYLSVDQSAGVIFSRATALEVRRRAQVLSPLMHPDWEIRTNLAAKHRATPKPNAPAQPLTAQILKDVCGDPQLGFVIARESLGFESIRHSHAGIWKDWNLYDCRHLQSSVHGA
jgi:hypothetical protein